MKILIYSLTLSLFVLLAGSKARAQSSVADTIYLSLKDAWGQAYENSKAIKEQTLKVAIEDEKILDEKLKILPELEVDGEYGKLSNIPVFVNGISGDPEYIPINDHSIYGVNAETYLNIYHGGATKTAIKSAKVKRQLQDHIREETIDQIHLETINHYLDLQRYFQFERLIRHNIEQSEERLRLVTELNKNGVVLKSDLLRTALQLSQQRTKLLNIQNNIAITSQALNILMGQDEDIPLAPKDSIELDGQTLDPDYDGLVRKSITQSPLEKMAEKQITISELSSRAIKADKLPSLGLFGTYSYSYPQIKLYPYESAPYLLGIAGIRLSYDISALYHDTHKEKAAETAIQLQKVARDNVEDVLRKKIKTAYKRYQEDLENVQVARKNIEQAQENYRIVDQTYFNQLALLTDLLDADNQLLQARFELVDHLAAAKSHYYQLLKISGGL